MLKQILSTVLLGDKQQNSFANFSKRVALSVFPVLFKQEHGTNNKRYATEIVADEAYFVDAKAEGSFGADAPAFQTQDGAKFEEVAGDDDLPF